MIQRYTFEGEGQIEFDDTKSVKELIEFAFDQFDYVEPFGMEIVTVFQCQHSKSNTGWFTLDTSKKCSEEIENRDELCFAYHMPGVFYFAEGGWGHHMTELGNHPIVENPVALIIKFDNFKNTVVINGNYSFRNIIDALKRTEYIDKQCNAVFVRAVYGDLEPHRRNQYVIPFSDSIMDDKLIDFEKKLDKYHQERLDDPQRVYHVILEIGRL